MSDTDITKIFAANSVVDFAQDHPLVLLGAVCVLILIIVAYCAYSYWPASLSEKLTTKSGGAKKDYLNDDEEIDSLVSSIREKQKRNIGQAK